MFLLLLSLLMLLAEQCWQWQHRKCYEWEQISTMIAIDLWNVPFNHTMYSCMKNDSLLTMSVCVYVCMSACTFVSVESRESNVSHHRSQHQSLLCSLPPFQTIPIQSNPNLTKPIPISRSHFNFWTYTSQWMINYWVEKRKIDTDTRQQIPIHHRIEYEALIVHMKTYMCQMFMHACVLGKFVTCLHFIENNQKQ